MQPVIGPVPSPRPPASPEQAGPLSQQHLSQLSAAKLASRRLRRTAAVARASAWTTGVLGSLTLLGILFGDLVSLALGAALIVVAIREGWLAGRLALLDPRSPRSLSINQLALGCVIVAYAAWQVRAALVSPGVAAAAASTGDPEVDAMLADVSGMARQITVGFYICVALVGAASTSLMALYYRSRQPILHRFLTDTPPWVVQVLRTG